MAANRFAVVWFCSLAKNRITAENGRFENIHSCWPHWSHISSKETEKVREIYWKVSGNRCSYLPQNPADPPKTTNTSADHMFDTRCAKIRRFNMIFFSTVHSTTSEKGLKHSSRCRKSCWRVNKHYLAVDRCSSNDATVNFGGLDFQARFWMERASDSVLVGL